MPLQRRRPAQENPPGRFSFPSYVTRLGRVLGPVQNVLAQGGEAGLAAGPEQRVLAATQAGFDVGEFRLPRTTVCKARTGPKGIDLAQSGRSAAASL